MRAWWLAGVLWGLGAASALGDPPTAAAFGRLPAIQRAVISPDGARVALLGGSPNQRALTIATLDSGKSAVALLGQVEANNVQWAGSGHLIVNAITLVRLDPGHVYHLQRDIVFDADGKALQRLLATNQASNYITALPVIAVLGDPHPTAIVEGLDWTAGALDASGQEANTNINRNKSSEVSNDLVSALWRADVAGGGGRIMERGAAGTENWDVDARGEARVRFDRDKTTDARILYGRARQSGAWKPIRRRAGIGGGFGYLGYSDPEDAIYLGIETATGVQVTRQALSDGAVSPVGGVSSYGAEILWDPYTRAPLAIINGGVADQWLDSEMGLLASKLGRAFKGRTVRLDNWSQDRKRLVIEVQSPQVPPSFYLFDATLGELSPLGEAYPELTGVAMGAASLTTYKARDGLEISAYVTAPPPDSRPTAARPLIVLPHGGPAAHDDPGFDWWAQYLATRGYVVLQPQFRGSTGYGEAFERAGDREWAGKMQTDLLDGVAALATRGLIDPKRVCIVGASYGGYAALAGAAFHSDVYRCAVSVNGISDLPLMLGSERRAYGHDAPGLAGWARILGESAKSGRLLEDSSPALHAGQVKAAVLLIHGEHDTTVPYEQSVHMQKALAAAGKSVQLITLAGDDHYLSTSATRTQMLRAVGDFLATALPVTP